MLSNPKKVLFRSALALLLACAGLTVLKPLDGEQAVIVLEFLGGFHPVLLHLPIGLWFGVLLLLLGDTLNRDRSLSTYLYGGGCATLITGVLAFLTGANLYLAGSYDKEVLAPHMYGALAFLVGVLAFCVLAERKAGLPALWLTALGSMSVLGFAGHIGGVITHGNPMEKAPWIVLQQQAEHSARIKEARSAGAEDPLLFDHVVLPILEGKCINCHGTSRAKGKLRMDSFEALVQGGSKGPSLIPGNPESSLMLERIHLPLNDKEHMPPKDKEQLTAEELAFLEWWVASAANPALKVREAQLPKELNSIVASFTGDSPDAIRRRRDREEKTALLEHHQKVAAAFPGILCQAVEGEARFELHSASMYDMDEAALRKLIQPLVPHLVRIDWHSRPLTDEWMTLLGTCRRLETLNLNQAKIAENDLIALVERNPSLHTLNFYGVAVSDAIIPSLTPRVAQGQLARINLSETMLTQEGIQELKNAIPKVTLRF